MAAIEANAPQNADADSAVAAKAAESEVKLDWKAQKEEQARLRKKENDLKNAKKRLPNWKPASPRSTLKCPIPPSVLRWQSCRSCPKSRLPARNNWKNYMNSGKNWQSKLRVSEKDCI